MIKKTKIIRKYNLQDKDNKSLKSKKIPALIKKSNLGSEKKIPINSKVKRRKTQVETITNEEGIVIALEVKCTCGENIYIELDYQ